MSENCYKKCYKNVTKYFYRGVKKLLQRSVPYKQKGKVLSYEGLLVKRKFPCIAPTLTNCLYRVENLEGHPSTPLSDQVKTYTMSHGPCGEILVKIYLKKVCNNSIYPHMIHTTQLLTRPELEVRFNPY